MLISKKEKYLIIGAGLTGLSAAYHLKDNYVIFEKEKTVGGLCRTVQWKGFYFDFSGHLLHLRDKYASKMIFSLMGSNIAEHNRQAYVHYRKHFVPFPFQANLLGMDAEVVKECLYGLVEARCSSKEVKKDGSFKDWVDVNFGKGFNRHFFQPYNTKLFGSELKDISSEWCEWFIPKPNVSQIVYGAFEYQNVDFGYNSKFYYPVSGGIQSLPSALAQRVKNIRLNTNANKIFWKEKKASSNGNTLTEYETLISTMPLPELLKSLDPFPEELKWALGALKWRSVHCLNLGVKKRDVINRHWIYFPEDEYIFYRVGFTHNFARESAPKDSSSLYIEIATEPGEDSSVNKLFGKAIIDLNRLNVLSKEDKITALQYMPMPYAYVVYNRDRQKALKIIFEFLKNNSIHSIGRYGAWKYSFMEESIIDGKILAEKILKNR